MLKIQEYNLFTLWTALTWVSSYWLGMFIAHTYCARALWSAFMPPRSASCTNAQMHFLFKMPIMPRC